MLSTAAGMNVSVLTNNVIYRLIDEVKARLVELLPKQYDMRVLGEATVQKVFKYGVKSAAEKTIAGCRVTNGSIQKTAKMRLLRDKDVLFEGR